LETIIADAVRRRIVQNQSRFSHETTPESLMKTQGFTTMRIPLIGIACTLLAGNTAFAAETSNPGPSDMASLKAEIEQLRSLTPGQSHAMIDVEYHFANLWFAGKNSNWPLATFYLNETRSRVQWALRIRPVRKLASGQDLDLKPMADAFEATGITAIRAALDSHDVKAFDAAYRATLSQCHACHVAAEKPFLNPQIPQHPASPLINAGH
jgi:hypothetical protein